jgi:hypothetical protein
MKMKNEKQRINTLQYTTSNGSRKRRGKNDASRQQQQQQTRVTSLHMIACNASLQQLQLLVVLIDP